MSNARKLADNLPTDGQLGGRNLIINGAMEVAQRGTSFSPPSSGAYVVDRFHQYQGGGGVLYYEQSTDAPAGFKNSLKITVNTADSSIASGDFYYMRYEAEGSDCSRLSLGTSDAQEFTFSFYVKSSLTGTFSGAFQNSAVNRVYVFEYTINSANTWERKTVTLTGDTSGTWLTNTSVGLRIAFDLGNGSSLRSSAGEWAGSGNYGSTGSVELVGTASATWFITGVQLEVGEATPFEHRSYGDELARCQRYYEKSFTQDTAPVAGIGMPDRIVGTSFSTLNNTLGTYQEFSVTKRASPTMTIYRTSAAGSAASGSANWYNGSSWQETTSITTSANERVFRVDLGSLTGAGFGDAFLVGLHYTADAEL